MKNNLLIAFYVVSLIGATYLGTKIGNGQSSSLPAVAQSASSDQSAKCTVVKKSVKKANGEIEESLEFSSESKQSSNLDQKAAASEVNKPNNLDLLTDIKLKKPMVVYRPIDGLPWSNSLDYNTENKELTFRTGLSVRIF